MTHISAEEISLLTADGVTLAADLWVPPGATAGAVVCHPHPALGGDRRNVVVDALFRGLGGAGVAVLRFDFRPTPRVANGEGVAQRTDVVAALYRLGAEVGGDVPLFLVGYSFGADVALSIDHERLAGWVVVAPPLAVVSEAPPAAAPGRPTVLVVPAHDQFAPPEAARSATAEWADTTLEEVPMADHFLVGRLDAMVELVLAALAVPET